MKQVMLGNEAIARGAYEAGCSVASAYPGTPSTEILQNLSKYSMLTIGVVAQVVEHGVVDFVHAGIHRPQQAADGDNAADGGERNVCLRESVRDDGGAVVRLVDDGGIRFQLFHGMGDVF